MARARRARKAGGRASPVLALPAWVQELIDYLRSTGELCHEGRRAVVTWVLWIEVVNKRRALMEVVQELNELFRKYARDYRERITMYQIMHAWNHWVSRGNLPPLSCRHVREACGTHDAPPLDC